MAGQANEGFHLNPAPTKQAQPTNYLADGEQRQTKTGDNQRKVKNDSTAEDTSLERTHWWARPEWWLVAIAGLTGCVIGWQSWETRKAAEGAKENAEVAGAQIKLMKQKERAQLRIELHDLKLIENATKDGLNVGFKVVNDGPTRAYILEQNIAAWIPEERKEKRKYWRFMGLPVKLPSDSESVTLWTILQGNELPPAIDDDQAKILDVLENRRFVVAEGSIRYKDVFGDLWLLSFCRIWRYSSFYGDPNALGGHWEWGGDIKANSEQQAT